MLATLSWPPGAHLRRALAHQLVLKLSRTGEGRAARRDPQLLHAHAHAIEAQVWIRENVCSYPVGERSISWSGTALMNVPGATQPAVFDRLGAVVVRWIVGSIQDLPTPSFPARLDPQSETIGVGGGEK
jgi:hypothetical protein